MTNMPNIITRLVLEHGNYDRGLQQAQKEVGKFLRENLSLGKAVESVTGVLASFAVGAGVVTSAVEVAKKMIASSETVTDNFGAAMEQAKSSVDKFFYSLTTGDFSGFINGLKETTRYAKAAYDALDDLGTFEIFKQPEVAEINERRDRLRNEIKTGKRYSVDENGDVMVHVLTQAELQAAKTELEQVGKDYIKVIHQTRTKEQEAYKAMSREILSGKNFKGSQDELDAAVDFYLSGYKGYTEATDRLAELNRQIAENTETTRVARVGGQGITTWETQSVVTAKGEEIRNSVEYRNLKAIAEIGDETLTELMKHRVSASQATSELNRALMGDEKVLRNVDGGGSGGMPGKPTVTPGELTAEAKLDFYVSGDPMDIVNQAIDDRKVEIPVELGPVDEEGFLGQDYADALQDAADQWDKCFARIQRKAAETTDTLRLIGDGISNLGALMGDEAGAAVQWIGQVVDSMQGMVPVIQSIITVKKMEDAAAKGDAIAHAQLAAVKAGESVAGVPLAGPALALAAITSILGMMASVRAISFAEGGIVPGQDFRDGISARISSGEMVINTADQKRLYDAIHTGTAGGGDGGGGAVALRGETIYVALNNYLLRSGKGRLVVGG